MLEPVVCYVACGNGLSTNVGGSIARSAHIAREWALAGADVRFVTTVGGRRVIEAVTGPLSHVVTLPAGLPWRREERSAWDRAIAYLVALAAAPFRVPRFEVADLVIYSDSDYPVDTITAALLKRRNPGARWVAQVHHPLSEAGAPRGLLQRISRPVQLLSWRLIRRQADAVLVYETPVGGWIGSWFTRHGFPAERVLPMTNGLDTGVFAPSAHPPAELRALFVGGVRQGKGLDEIPEIWRRVVQAVPSARLMIAGGMSAGDQRELLSRLSVLGIAHTVDLLGPVPHERVPALMRDARLYVNPGTVEGFGTAIYEALAAGLPVAAFDLPAYRGPVAELIHTAPAGDCAALAGIIVDELSRAFPSDDAERRRTFAATYDWAYIAERERALVESLSRRTGSRFDKAPRHQREST